MKANPPSVSPKVKSVNELAQILSGLRSHKKIVLCHGVYDLLHVGHIRHLQQARALGDVLVTTLTPDRFVNKGPHRPAFPEALRAEALAALDCTDYVAINDGPNAVDLIASLQPHFYVKGSDYRDANQDHTGKIVDEQIAVEAVGGQIVFTDDITFSSSALINRYLPSFSPEVMKYLGDFKQKYSASDVLKYLEKAKDLTVAVVGETIIDEYHYCEAIGKSGKEPVLATRYLSAERFAGGVLAVANHISNFCKEVHLVTALGGFDSDEEFVRQNLKPNVKPTFIYRDKTPTIIKRRFVEGYLLQKLFEVYVMDDREMDEAENRSFCSQLGDILPGVDLTVVADYGHGVISRSAVDLLAEKAPFLVVNTQSNAGNRGFNTISKYPRADYICLAHPEMALETRKRFGNTEQMVLDVSRRLACPRLMVTIGKYGNLYYKSDVGFANAPSFTSSVVDRVGAGDAVLSLSSLFVAQDAPMDIVTFIGNVAGAEAVATLGHRSFIERPSLYKHVESLLK